MLKEQPAESPLRPFEGQEKEKLQEAKEEWQLSAVRAVKRVKPAVTSSQTCNNSTSDTSERLGLVKPAATLQLLEPSCYTQQCLRHNQRSAWFCSDQISLGSDISLTSDLSERPGLVVSPPSTRVCSRDEQLVSRFIHSNQHQQSSFNSRLDLGFITKVSAA